MTSAPKREPLGGLIFYEAPDGHSIDVYAFYDHEKKDDIQPIITQMMYVVNGTFVKDVQSIPKEFLSAFAPDGLSVVMEQDVPDQEPEGYA